VPPTDPTDPTDPIDPTTAVPSGAGLPDEAGWEAVGRYVERNVLGGPLELCSADPVTGFYRDGCCTTGPEDLGSHTICAVMTAEFLAHQRAIGNDLSTPMPQYHFPGLIPGDRWCVTAVNWARAYNDGVAAPVVLASTNERVLEIVPLEALRDLAVDVPDDPGALA
jgi:uncharacterized protein (DUF2237 family)